MSKIGKVIRIVAASVMSIVVFFGMLKLGMFLQVPHLIDVWEMVLVLACGIITYENVKIWREQDSKVVNAD